jgi:hypothetical protein
VPPLINDAPPARGVDCIASPNPGRGAGVNQYAVMTRRNEDAVMTRRNEDAVMARRNGHNYALV